MIHSGVHQFLRLLGEKRHSSEWQEGGGGGQGCAQSFVRILAVETQLGMHPGDTGAERCAAMVLAGRGYGSSRMAYTIIRSSVVDRYDDVLVVVL